MITTIKQVKKIIATGASVLFMKDTHGVDYTLLIIGQNATLSMEAVKGKFIKELKDSGIIFPSTSYFINLSKLAELS